MLTILDPVVVRLVTTDVAQAAPVPLTVILPVPKATVLPPEPDDENNPTVNAYETRSSVPLVNVSVLVEPIAKALPSNQLPPTPFNVTEQASVVPFVVIVLPVVVALNVSNPVADHTVPAIRDIEPDITNVPVDVKVIVPAETVISRHLGEPDSVTVYVPD
jgi:ABC-type tungstate transport system substrate-binding protein